MAEMTVSQYRRNLISKFTSAKTDGERALVIKNANLELAQTISYTRGFFDKQTIQNWVDELLNEVNSVHDSLRRQGYSMDPTGVRIKVDPKTQRQLANSSPMLPFGDFDRMVLRDARQRKGTIIGGATAVKQGTAASTKALFEGSSRVFSLAQLYRFSYVPKNSIFEPLLAATLAEGSAFWGPMFTQASKSAIKGTSNVILRGVSKSRTLLPSAKKEIQREVEALSEQYNLAIINRDNVYSAYYSMFDNTVGVSPATKRDWADDIRGMLREAEKDVAAIESKLNTYTIDYGKPFDVPSVYNLRSRIETLKAAGKQVKTVSPEELTAPILKDEASIISILNSQRNKGLTVDNFKQFEESIISYTNGSGDYSLVNSILRGEGGWLPKESARAEKIINDLDALIRRAPALEESITTYRGIADKNLAEKLLSLKPGESFTDNAFASTSLKESVAENFARFNGYEGKQGKSGVVLEIVNPVGTKGIFPLGFRTEVDSNLAMRANAEQEFLLPRDTKFTVIEVSGNKIKVIVPGKTELTAEAINASRYASEIRSAEITLQKAVGDINTLAPEINVIDADIAAAYARIGKALEELGPKNLEKARLFSVAEGRYAKKPILAETQKVILSNGQTLEFKNFASRNGFGEGYMSEIASNSTRTIEFLGNKATVGKITTVKSRSPKNTTYTSSPLYFDELSYVVNNHMRGDLLVDRILAGETRDEIIANWSKTQQARYYMKEMGHSPDDIIRVIDEQISYVDRYLPTPEAKLAASQGAVGPETLRGLLGDKLNQMVPIQPLDIQYARPTSVVKSLGQASDALLGSAWQKLMAPENVIREVWGTSRHNVIIAEKAEALLAQGYTMDMASLNRIHHAAAVQVADEVASVFYTIPRQHRALYLARGLATFPNAAASGIYRYGRFAVKKTPRFNVFLNSYYSYYGSFGVDQYGNPVDDPMKAEYLLIPGTKELGLNKGKGVIVNARATNYVANFPGASWLVPIALSSIYGNKPNDEDQIKSAVNKTFGKIPGYSYEELFPYGIEQSTTNQLYNTFTPAWARNLRQFVSPDKTNKMFVDSWISEGNRQWAVYEMKKDADPTFKGAMPTPDSIMAGAKNIYLRKFRTQMFSILGSPQVVESRPDRMYQDIFYNYYNANIAKGQKADDAWKNAESKFQAQMLAENGAKFPMERLFVSSQDSVSYITPSAKAYNRIWEDFPGLATTLRQVDPSVVGLMVADLPKEYSPQVNRFLNSTTARLPDGTPVNSALKTPQLVEEEIEKSRFWAAYTAEKKRLNKFATDAEYASYLSVPELKDALKDYAVNSLGKASPVWFKEYEKGATTGNQAALQARGLYTVVNDEKFMNKFGKTQFWQHAKAFVTYRNQYAKAYADAPSGDGRGTKSYIAAEWQNYMASTLEMWDPTLRKMIDRYFENDNLRESR